MHRVDRKKVTLKERQAIRVLMVTRERAADQLYGLHKSLVPILKALEGHKVEYRYLTQSDAGQQSLCFLQSLHRGLSVLLRPILRGTETTAMVWNVLERLNMGRLAAKVAVAEGWTHVHCHDPLIAWGFHGFLRWRYRSARLCWGVSEHGFGCYAQAIHEDGVRLGQRVMAWMRRTEAKVLGAAHWVICPTHLAQAQLQRDLALPRTPAHFHVIPHPCPKLELPDKRTARKLLGWTEHEWVWLAVGRLVPLKAFDRLIEAFAQLVATHTASTMTQRLHIAGGGDATSLLALAQALQVADQVSISETDQITLYYAAVDGYVSTSRTESFGMANLEALAAGLPALVTAVGGVPEVVGDAAILMPADTPEIWASMMRNLLENADERQRLSLCAMDRVRQWPADTEIARAYLALYTADPVPEIRLSVPRTRGKVTQQSRPLFQTIAPLNLEKITRVLVFAPHPDDETLGCGGLMALLANRGVRVQACIVSDGGLGDPEGRMPGDVIQRRETEACHAAAILGSLTPRFMRLPDGGLSTVSDLSKRMENEIAAFQPDCILLPAECDAHLDHVVTACAGWHAARKVARDARVLCYEIWTPLPVNRLLDVSEVFSKKTEALCCYELPLSCIDYLSAAKGLAQYRSIHLPAGRGFAEGYLEL